MPSIGEMSTGPFSNSVCHVYQTANYSNTAAADLTFNTNPFNSSWWVVGSPTIVTLPYKGYYLLHLDFTLFLSGAGINVGLRVNGADYYLIGTTGGGAVNYRYFATLVSSFNANDTLSIRIHPNGAGTYTVYGWSSANTVALWNNMGNAGYTPSSQKTFSLYAEFLGGNY